MKSGSQPVPSSDAKKLIRRRIPYLIALVGLGGELFGAVASENYLEAGLLLAAVIVNVLALRLIPKAPASLEILALSLDSVMAGITAWNYWRDGSQAIHYVWCVAAILFAIASLVVFLKRGGPEQGSNRNNRLTSKP